MAKKKQTIEDRILEGITFIRSRHNACTARRLAEHLHLSQTYIGQRLTAMRALGRVDWTDMPGSVRIINDGIARPAPAAPKPSEARLKALTIPPPFDPVAAAREQIKRGELDVPDELVEAVGGMTTLQAGLAAVGYDATPPSSSQVKRSPGRPRKDGKPTKKAAAPAELEPVVG